MGTNHGNAMDLGGVEGKKRAVILEQHSALFGNLLRDFEAAEHVDDTLPRRIIDDSGGKHRSKNPVDMVIQFRLRHFARLNVFLQLVAVEDPAWLFVIESSRCWPSPALSASTLSS